MAYTGDPLNDDDRSPFLSFLDYIDEPGQVVKNLLRGNFGAAGRHVLNFAGDTIDAALPGNWIPKATNPEDNVSSSELIGLDEKEHPVLGFGANLIGDTLLNPLSWLSPGAGAAGKMAVKAGLPFAKGALEVPGSAKAIEGIGALAKKGYGKLTTEGFRKGAETLATDAKETLGWLNPNPAARATIADARALRSRASKAGMEEAQRIMAALPEDLQVMAGDVIDNLKHGDDGVKVLKPDLGRRAGAIESIDQQVATLRARVEQHPAFEGMDDAAKLKINQAIEDSIRLAHTQYLDDLKHGGLAKPQQYTDPSGKTYMKDELEEMYRQEQGIAKGLQGKDEALSGRVHDLDVETNLANRLANQKAGTVERRVQTEGGKSLNQALRGAGAPLQAVFKTKKGGQFIDHLDPYFPRLFDEIKLEGGPTVAKPSSIQKVVDAGNVTFDRSVKRKFGPEVGPTGQLKSEFKRQLRRDETLAGKQGDVARELENIDPGKFDEFTRGRGLSLQDVDVSNASPRNYLKRMYELPEDNEINAMRGGGLNATKARKYDTDELLAQHLSDPANGKGYERNAYKRLLSRSDEQGRILEKATIAKHVLGDRFTNLVDGVYKQADSGTMLYDKSVTGAFDEAINAMAKADPESARALANAYHGAKARGPILEVIAKANRWFKPAAVYGVAIPKMGSIVRNDLGTSWQALTTQGAEMAGKNLARTPRRLWDSINDGTAKAFGWKHYKPDNLTADLHTIEDAYKGARGSEDAVMQLLESGGRHDLAEAVRHGVTDGFVSMEEIMSRTAASPWWKKKFFDIYDAPAEVFQGVEQRARLGNFMDRLHVHGDARKAAAEGKEAFLDYNVGGSAKNRTLRDLIPFAAFLTGSVKQQGKFLAKNPAAGVALSSALGKRDEDPIYPYMEGKLNLPMWDDEAGNPQYASGLGLPIEALGKVPGSWRDFKREIIGSSQPLLKSALGAAFDQDPYFETPFGSYSKLPGNIEAGDAGRAYNVLAGTGLIQPLDSILSTAGKVIDDRRGAGAKALDMLTGANVVSVDPDLALQQQLQEALKTNPDVRQYRGYFADSGDDATQALIRAYSDAKAKLKKKRKAKTDER